MRILLVEDNPGDVDLIREALSSSKDTIYEIDNVERLSNALIRLSKESYDIILLDLGLPDSNGFQALKLLRIQFPDIPVIVITGNHNEEIGIQAVQAGAQDYLVKGCSSPISDLSRVISHAVERSTSEKKIRESENFLRSTIDSLSALIVIIDNKGNIISTNKAWNDFFERNIIRPQSWTNENYISLLKKSGSKSVMVMVNAIERILNNKLEVFESEVFFKIKDYTFWFRIIAKQFSGIKFNRAVITHENITQKKEYELNLRASEEKFKSIINNIGTGVLLVNKLNVIVETNSRIKKWFPELEQENNVKFETLFPLLKEENCPVQKTLKTCSSHVLTIGKNKSTFRVVSSPLFDDKHEILSVVLLMEDITKILAREKRMRQIQKMEAIGTLAGGIAHDFNNILTAILGYTELGMSMVQGNETKLPDYLKQIHNAGTRAAELVKQILTFSRKTELELKPLNLSPIVKEALKLIRSTTPTTIKINQKIESDLGQVLADATQIHQIIMNLCTNASAAMEDKGGTLEVNLRSPNEEELPEFKYENNHIILEVKDTGTGMNQEVLDSIFIPYFTTKDIEEGTGLGLSVVHGIVTDYNGLIFVSSELEKGTTFRICLPLSENLTNSKELQLDEKKEIPTGKEKILLVDDELPILHVGKKILEKNGYEITTMADSIKALEEVKNQPDKFDLVITDMTMPKLTGEQLAIKINEIRQDLPIILWTGYSKVISQEKIESIGIKSLLMKPFSKDNLLIEVRKVLDSN